MEDWGQRWRLKGQKTGDDAGEFRTERLVTTQET